MNDNHFAWHLVSEIVTQEPYAGLPSLLPHNTKYLPYPVNEGECGQRTFHVSWPWLVLKLFWNHSVSQPNSSAWDTGLVSRNEAAFLEFSWNKERSPTKASPSHGTVPQNNDLNNWTDSFMSIAHIKPGSFNETLLRYQHRVGCSDFTLWGVGKTSRQRKGQIHTFHMPKHVIKPPQRHFSSLWLKTTQCILRITKRN